MDVVADTVVGGNVVIGSCVVYTMDVVGDTVVGANVVMGSWVV
jgi:hypothetical protein